ncbi:putative thiamine pyrophosphokinase [Aspergillus saccharolyticus JOP 1030-1]|uniref:Putative thiamine pyrophosphokinase n=1 Tax=Aspergillus saccharolyticus JOP 1030-1 TaxID=1450539 RepID=A0A318Z5Y8_9EURO|nr:putative thiamine pyrophosphokinase [Aspergillus saccharolyticus JOP 1030-1]PYH40163.1 putative thiamine pyrophosphokinase [Aspergillus saccharolyticus JOP 1030-1]
MESLLDVVRDCDNYPYPEDPDPTVYNDLQRTLWKFYLPEDPQPHGLLIDSVVRAMPWTSDFDIVSHPYKEVRLRRPAGPDWQSQCTQIIAHQMERARELGVFPQLGRLRGEWFPIVGARFPVAIDRSAFSMWGIIGQGVHMTVYTRNATGWQFWIPQRNPNKSTYPGLLDNAVAGGMAMGETPRECLVREAGEEAGLSADVVEKEARAAGTVTWMNISDARAGGQVGLINPGVLFVYDLEINEQEVLRPVDGDVYAFHRMGMLEVKEALLRKRFKPSSGAVMLDFLIRHGLVNPEEEKHYAEIVTRLHRKLPLPCSASA